MAKLNLLAGILAWEEKDVKEAIAGIQQGLDDFEAGRFRTFQDFADEQRRKYKNSLIDVVN